MKKRKIKSKIIIVVMLLFLATGCTTTLVDKDNKAVQNPETGQSLTENILCQPENEQTRKLYEENGVKLKDLPKCSEFTPGDTEYDGLWTGIFVKPLAFLILTLGKYIGSFALSIIIITIIIRIILFPFTRKMAVQSEMMKKASPELARIQKKYEGKTDQDSMLKQNQEMMMVYKKYNFNPLTSCLISFIQLPLLFAFLEAINRVPAIFEENFLGIQLGTTPLVGFGSETFYMYIILLLIIGGSTIFMFKTTSNSASDPSMKMMPIMMSVIIIITAFFMPSALGIYWSVGNIFAIVQNIVVMRGMEKHDK